MFDYFRNYSSNAHHVCCEESPTKGLYMTIASPMTLTFTQGQKRVKLDYFLTCNISDNMLSCCIQTWHDGS